MRELQVRIHELSGSYYNIGYNQASDVEKSEYQSLQIMSSSVDAEKARGLLGKYSPHLLDELSGLAAGIDRDINTIIQMYSGYDLELPAMGCTAFSQGESYIRNYDFSPELYDARIVLTTPNTGYASIGFSQNLIGRLDGMNEKGLVVGLHFVNNHQQNNDGFIATTVIRMILDQCKDVQEAIQLIQKVPHLYDYNYSLLDKNGNKVIVEGSPIKQIIRNESPLICTNHYESERLSRYNRTNIENSIKRKSYLQSLSNHKNYTLETTITTNTDCNRFFYHSFLF